MIDRSEFVKINPISSDNPFEKDSFEQFEEKFKEFFPRFPSEVVKQWPYECFNDFVSEKRWQIEYDRLEFRKGCLKKSDFKLLESELFSNEELREMGLWHLSDEDKLTKYIRKNLTYPVPIIVLDSLNSNLSGKYEFKKPYFILEGHRRSSLMRALIETDDPEIPEYHEIWKVTRI